MLLKDKMMSQYFTTTPVAVVRVPSSLLTVQQSTAAFELSELT